MLKLDTLMNTGFHISYFPLSEDIRKLVNEENWKGLDDAFRELTSSSGRLFKFLQNYHDFNSIEFILSIRDAANDWEEDGIWHDDVSRVFAFSLSLTENAAEIEGGRLGVKNKHEENITLIPTPEFGGIILFLTGIYGFEHKIHQVTKGRRIIIAGWCS